VSVGLGGTGGGNGGGGGNEVGRTGWERERKMLAPLWEGSAVEWTGARSEQLFEGILEKLETRRRRRRVMRMVITCAGLAVTILVGLGLVGFGVNGPFAHFWSRVQSGWSATTPLT
jgi:hypothetical protein